MTPSNVTDDGQTLTIALDGSDVVATIVVTEAAQAHGRVVIWTLRGEPKHRFEPRTAAKKRRRK